LQLCDEISQLALVSADLFQPYDQRSTFSVGFLEKALEDEGQTMWTIVRGGSCEARYLGHSLFSRYPSRREASYEIGNLRIGVPVAKAFQLWASPVCGCGQLWHQPLLTGPVRILGPLWCRKNVLAAD
jgi:hypothetical protein